MGPMGLHRVDAKYSTSYAGWAQTSRVFAAGPGVPCIARHQIIPLGPGWWMSGCIPGKGAPGVGG